MIVRTVNRVRYCPDNAGPIQFCILRLMFSCILPGIRSFVVQIAIF